MKDIKRKFVPRKKMLKQQEGSIRIDFSTYVKIFKESNEVGASVEVYSKVLTGSLL